MPLETRNGFHGPNGTPVLHGHALRNANLRERSLLRSQTAPPLARMIVEIRAQMLGMTRLELSRRSGISRGTLRDLELGVHTPTRRILQRFVSFCDERKVACERIEELRRLYAGSGATLEQFIARLELKAGSPRVLAKRVGISPATLWEYRRGNFPLPLSLLRRMCEAVGEEARTGELLWQCAERSRFIERGYPESLAEFWVLCSRQGYAENRLLKMGLSTATVRRLRYLEPTWKEIEPIARKLCGDNGELGQLRDLWTRDEGSQRGRGKDGFGAKLLQLRKQQGVSRRQLADLFGIGGKKPARIIKYIEEDGFYSAQAHPAGLAALLAGGTADEPRLLQLWQQRRSQFHRRHRPETRIDLRLARELYGFELPEMEPVLGYSNLEYQKIERGVTTILDTARERIVNAIHQAGQIRVKALLKKRESVAAERVNWQAPPTVTEFMIRLARREGGLVPLARLLRKAGVKGTSPARLRQVVQGKEVPPWYFIDQVADKCDVTDLDDVRQDWHERFREQLQIGHRSPLGVELRVLMAEVAPTMRAFSPRLGFNYSVLVRDMQRIDRDQPVKWFHVERILKARGLNANDEHWREIRAWWYTAAERCRPADRMDPKHNEWQGRSHS